MSQELKFVSIKPHLNEKFLVSHEPYGEQELELISAEDYSNNQLETFSLTFSGKPDKLLPQQTHLFKHEKLGVIEMFITPIQSSTKELIHYQAIFNRLTN